MRLCVLAHVVGWERGDVGVSCACFAVVWTWWVRSVEEWDATSFVHVASMSVQCPISASVAFHASSEEHAMRAQKEFGRLRRG